MRTSVVLGAAGFIGSHLCDALLASNYSVIAVDDFSSGRMNNIEHLLSRNDFNFIEQDICNPISIIGEVDLVFNFASLASPPRYLKQPIHTVGVSLH